MRIFLFCETGRITERAGFSFGYRHLIFPEVERQASASHCGS